MGKLELMVVETFWFMEKFIWNVEENPLNVLNQSILTCFNL